MQTGRKAGLFITLCFVLLPLCFSSAYAVNLVEKEGRSYEIYFVKKTDTLWSIAKEKLNSSYKWTVLREENHYIINPDRIYPGQPILIPLTESSGATAAGNLPSHIESVAVIKFTNKGKKDDVGWLSMGLAEAVSTDMGKIEGLKVVERENVEAMLEEKQFAELSITEGKIVKEIGLGLDASHIVGGSYSVKDDRINIEGSLYEVVSDRVVKKAEVRGKLENIFELERLLTLKLFGEVLNISDDVRAGILSGEKTSLEAFKEVSKGKSLSYMGNTKEAREYYQKALERDPDYKTALEELKASVSTADTLAVMPLTNATGKKDLEWLSLGIAEALSTDIKKMTGIFLVERTQVEKALEELKLGTMGGIVDEKTAPQLGKMVGAGIMLLGSYQTINNHIRIDIRMVDVASSQILLSEMVTGDMDKIFEVEHELASKVAAALHVDLSPEEKERLMAEKPDIESFKRYIMAQGTVEVLEKPAPAGSLRAIAITDFDNATKNPDHDWMIKAIPGSLNTEMKNLSKVNLIERTQIEKALEELKLADTGLMTGENIPQIGKIIGADALLTGLYQVRGETIRIDAKLVKVETGEMLGARSVSGSLKEIFEVEKKLAQEIAIFIESLSIAEQKTGEEGQGKEQVQSDEIEGENVDEIISKLKEKQKKKSDEEAIEEVNKWINSIKY